MACMLNCQEKPDLQEKLVGAKDITTKKTNILSTNIYNKNVMGILHKFRCLYMGILHLHLRILKIFLMTFLI